MKNKSFLPNPGLKSLGILVGEWETVGTHPLLPGITLRGRTSFDWIEGGSFLAMRSSIEHPVVPEGIAIFNLDDSTRDGFMIYFDDRGVSRNYKWFFEDNLLRWWRDAPGFSQRYSLIITDNGNSIISKGELSKDDSTWENDLDLTYKRIR